MVLAFHFGVEYDTCYISNQGTISLANNGWFNSKPAGYKNPAQPSKLISAWGMPFDLNAGGKILFQQFPGKFILQYQDVVHGSYTWDASSPSGVSWLEEAISFQIVLHRNGDINFNYKDLGEVLGTRELGFNRAFTLIMIEDFDLDDRLVLNGYGTVSGRDPFIEGIYPATGQQIYFKNPGFGSLKEVSNAYGTVNVGDSVKISFNGLSDDLYVGDFEERINIVSNDPVNRVVTHTINLGITSGGEVNYTFEPGAVDFGDIFEGAVHTSTLSLGNDGFAIGQINTVSFENGLFDVEGYMPVELRPGTFAEYKITATADALGNKEDVLVFTAATGDTYRVNVKCNVIEAPFISSNKTELKETLIFGDTKDLSITINNDGLNAMQVNPSANEWMNVTSAQEGVAVSEVDYIYTIEHNTESDFFIPSGVMEMGSKLKTPEDPLDPDHFWMTIPLPYEVSFYGQPYDTLYVGITGIICFLPDQEPRQWGPDYFIPNAEGVNGFLAPLFGFNGLSNPEFYPETGIYYKAYEDKFVMRWQDMGSGLGGKPTTVEIWMYKNGIIKYMYERDPEMLDHMLVGNSLVGIENPDGTKGIQVSARTNGIIQSGTVVTFLPKQTFEVPANGSVDFNVYLNAQSLYHGQYTDNLVFENNTPSAPDFSIPVTLDIIGKDSIVVKDSLAMGELMIIDHDNEDYTSPVKRYDFDFTLSNAGQRTINIRQVKLKKGFNYGQTMGDDSKFGNGTSSDGWTDISRKTLNYQIKPLDKETFRLRVYPLAEALVNDTIMIYCDVEGGVVKVPVSSVFTLPPVVNIQSEGVHVYANTSEHEETRTLTIDNINGSTQLDYELSLTFERNVNPYSNTKAAKNTYAMPSTNIAQLEWHETDGLKSTKADNNEEFNRVLQYEEVTSSAGNVGFGTNNMSFTSVTGFYAPDDGFNLSHVMTWYAWGDLLDSYIDITILGGSEDYYECDVLYTQRYHHLADAASSLGELITIELDESQYFFSNEKFFIQFTYDEFIGYPQGTHDGTEEVHQRYYFGNGTDLFETTEKGYGALGWIVRAAEKESSINAWSILNSDSQGNVLDGQTKQLELGFNSAYAKQGINKATLRVKTNDPYQPTVEVPISLTRNKGPQYTDGFEVNYSIIENDTLVYKLAATDEEDDSFTLSIVEDQKYFSYEQSGNEIEIVFMPDFDGAGQHQLLIEGVDSYGNTTQFALNVMVADLNRAPIEHITIGEQVYAIETDDAYTLNLSDYIIDPDGDAITFEVTYQETEAVEILKTNSTLAFAANSPGYVYVNVVATDELGAQLETGFPVFIEHRTGIDDTNADELRVYPNPVQDVLHVSLKGHKVSQFQIIDLAGSIVCLQGEASNDMVQQINVDELQSGIYLLKLYTKDKVIIKKFTKK